MLGKQLVGAGNESVVRSNRSFHKWRLRNVKGYMINAADDPFLLLPRLSKDLAPERRAFGNVFQSVSQLFIGFCLNRHIRH
jgi:hypothetical protein